MLEDDFQFLDEDEPTQETESATTAWNILIVDDDEQVHHSTSFMLKGIEILGARLQLHHCYYAEQSLEFLKQNPEPAVILLDVVMETDTAGLDLVEKIRTQLDYRRVRIILRTGQAGYAPELKVINEYDINDYRLKSELSRTRLITSLTSALRGYQQIMQLENSQRGLQIIIEATRDLLSIDGFKQFSQGILTQIEAFLGLSSSEGLVMLSVPSESNDTLPFEIEDQKIVAATGRFANLQNQAKTFWDETHKQRLQQVLSSKQHLFDSGCTVLYCVGQQFSMLVYVETLKPLNSEQKDLLSLFGQNISLMANNLSLIERLNQQAFFDPLTLLPNRNSLLSKLDEYLGEAPKSLYFIHIDLDFYSNLQGALGQGCGDELVRAYARLLQQQLGEQALMLAHLGTDDFVVLLQRQPEAESFQALLNQKLQLQSFSVHLMATAISFSISNDGYDSNQILSAAKLFMLEAQQKHRRKLSFYSLKQLDGAHLNIKLLQELVQAIPGNQLQMYFQPKWNIQRQAFYGQEALIRWIHPQKGFISPGQFIPLVESSGLSEDLFEWILHAVFKDYAALCQAVTDPGQVAINMSALQLGDFNLRTRLLSLSQRYQVPLSKITLEITESAALEGGTENAIEMLQNLRDEGISIALDDFGTGYSSFSYLSSLPVDQIKLDRSFIQKMHEESGLELVKTMIQLSHALKLRVVAEGVEQASEAEQLAQFGCDSIQGFYYAKPMPLAALIEWHLNPPDPSSA